MATTITAVDLSVSITETYSLNNIQYGGLNDARRANATLYLLQTFKPLDFPKVSGLMGNDTAGQLIATLRAINQASTPPLELEKQPDNIQIKE